MDYTDTQFDLTDTRLEKGFAVYRSIKEVPSSEFRSLCVSCASFSEMLILLGLARVSSNYEAIRKRAESDGIVLSFPSGLTARKGRRFPGQRRIPSDELFRRGTRHSGRTLKDRLLADGIVEDRCSVCGLEPVWMESPLVLRLDHIDGDTSNNERGNLRLICPNCDSQTPTFAGRNKWRLDYEALAVRLGRQCQCGGIIRSKTASSCTSCSAKMRGMDSRVVPERPSAEVLLASVLSRGYSATGRTYGVSDNAIRKWLRGYGITPPAVGRGCKKRQGSVGVD